MRILVDADACPVKHIIINVARKYNIPVVMFINTSHRISDGYSKVVIADKQRDSADLALISQASVRDIVITQDYGVAILAIGKGARALNQNGLSYTIDNIDRLIFESHLSQKIRYAEGRISGPQRRNRDDDVRFQNALVNLIAEIEKSIENEA
ncbi:MAG: YaiI/YqxD family protein [Clostridiaceae bacterium]|nr:YaiI/YqxD family protein [Clostridiaceae bacterium]